MACPKNLGGTARPRVTHHVRADAGLRGARSWSETSGGSAEAYGVFDGPGFFAPPSPRAAHRPPQARSDLRLAHTDRIRDDGVISCRFRVPWLRMFPGAAVAEVDPAVRRKDRPTASLCRGLLTGPPTTPTRDPSPSSARLRPSTALRPREPATAAPARRSVPSDNDHASSTPSVGLRWPSGRPHPTWPVRHKVRRGSTFAEQLECDGQAGTE
jgi:hypothetical protein